MERGYTAEQYREMMGRIRDVLPEATVSSDFIVGFCGETEEDFRQTVDLVRECRFKNCFIFKYSERPGTKAAGRFEDDVPYGVKQRRNNELLAVQDAISEEDNLRLIGRRFDVLVEGPSKAAAKRGEEGRVSQLTGRTSCDRIVVFRGGRRQIGRILPVSICGATAHTLFGEVDAETAGPQIFRLEARGR
jgi:tRNA-2-methylthio-N6-dimethylallyladenosine synthase